MKRILYKAFGEEKTLPEWSRDRRCKVCLATLRTRIWDLRWRSVQRAITLPASPLRKNRALRGSPLPLESGIIPGVVVGVDTCPRCLQSGTLYSGGPHFRLCLDCALGVE